MVDIELLAGSLRKMGHNVEHTISVPEDAGGYELTVDGTVLSLEEAEALLEADQEK